MEQYTYQSLQNIITDSIETIESEKLNETLKTANEFLNEIFNNGKKPHENNDIVLEKRSLGENNGYGIPGGNYIYVKYTPCNPRERDYGNLTSMIRKSKLFDYCRYIMSDTPHIDFLIKSKLSLAELSEM
jgi:hypothetical protein